MKQMTNRKTWKEFRDVGLLWWINRMLHLFGWAIVVEVDSDGSISEAYPAYCKFRGFAHDVESEGFEKLTKHMTSEAERLLSDLDE